MDNLELREIAPSDRSLIEQIGQLRVSVWATEIPDAANMGTWLDSLDEIARHWIVLRDGELVASARMTIHERIEDVPDPEVYAEVFRDPLRAPIASINRLVVAPTARGLGLSKRLDSCRVEAAKQAACRCIVASTPSGDHRVKQLEAVGFTAVGRGSLYTGPAFYASRSAVVLIRHLA